MKITVTEPGTEKEWDLEVSDVTIHLTPTDDPDGATFSFVRESFHHEVKLSRFLGKPAIIANCPKTNIFSLPPESVSEITDLIGKPTKVHLKRALKELGGKFNMSCGIGLVLLSLPVLGMEFDPITMGLGICFLSLEVIIRLIIHPKVILLTITLPVLVILQSIYYQWTGKPLLLGLWIIPVMLLPIWTYLGIYKRFKDTDLSS